jgi:hypothetical protein
VEAAGVEPASENDSERTSTRVSSPFDLVAVVDGWRPTIATIRQFLALGVPAPLESQSDWRGVPQLQTEAQDTVVTWFLIRQREQQARQQCCRSQLQFCPFLRGHGRHDARSGPHHPRRNRYAPSCHRTAPLPMQPHVGRNRGPTMGPGAAAVKTRMCGVIRSLGIPSGRVSIGRCRRRRRPASTRSRSPPLRYGSHGRSEYRAAVRRSAGVAEDGDRPPSEEIVGAAPLLSRARPRTTRRPAAPGGRGRGRCDPARRRGRRGSSARGRSAPPSGRAGPRDRCRGRRCRTVPSR